MSSPDQPRVHYVFQRVPAQGHFDVFGRSVCRLLEQAPWRILQHNVGTNSGVYGGVLDARGVRLDGVGVRVKAIHDCDAKGRNLLRNDFDEMGLLKSSEYFDKCIVRFQYDRRGPLKKIVMGTESIQFEHDDALRPVRRVYGEVAGQPYRIDFQSMSSQAKVSSSNLNVSSGMCYSYEWASDGWLRRANMPGHWIEWQRDRCGLVEAMKSDVGRIQFNGDGTGKLAGACIEAGNLEAEFVPAGGTMAVQSSVSDGGKTVTRLTPFGIDVNDQGGLRRWLSLDGGFLEIERDTRGKVHRLWTSSGPNTFFYEEGKNGRLSALLRSDGTRYAWYREPRKPYSFVIGPEGAALHWYRECGTIERLQNSWGGGAEFKVGRRNKTGWPEEILSSVWGRVVVKYGGRRITKIDIDGKGCVEFVYSKSGDLIEVSWTCHDIGDSVGLLLVAGWFWWLMAAAGEAYVEAFEWMHLL